MMTEAEQAARWHASVKRLRDDPEAARRLRDWAIAEMAMAGCEVSEESAEEALMQVLNGPPTIL
jgi:coenzyme F420-reducing hydrogenase gamma subunit